MGARRAVVAVSRWLRAPQAWPLLVLLLTSLYVIWTPPLWHVLSNLLPLFFASVVVLSWAGLGSPLMQRILPDASDLDRFLIAAAFGAGLSGLWVFVPGVLSVVNPSLYAMWVILGLALFVPFALRHRWRGSQAKLKGVETVTVVSCILITVNMLQVLPTLVSPVVTTDAMEYHLMVPKIALATGAINPLPSLLESHYPALASYLYQLVMPLAGDITCKGIHFLAGIGVLLAMYRLTVRSAPQANGLFAPALYLTMPVAVNLFGWAWNDNLFVFFVLLGLGQILDFHDDPAAQGAWKHLLVAGTLLGLAAWTKYTIVLILLAVGPLLLFAVWQWRWRPQHLVILAAPVGVISMLVFVKNWFFTGNPFFPFLHELFPSPFWNDASNRVFHEALRRWEHPDWSWYSVLLFPVNLCLKPRLIDVHTGVLVLATAPFAFFRSRNRAQALLKGLLVTYVAAWMLIQTETRSLLVFFAVLLVAAAPRVEQLVFAPTSHRRAAVCAVLAASAASFWVSAVSSSLLTSPMRYFFGLESRRSFLSREAEAYPVLDWLNQNPNATGALLVGLKRPYYAEKPIWFSAFADIPIAEVLTRGTTTADEMLSRFRHVGVSHIVVDRDVWEQDHNEGLYSWSDRRREAFEAVLNRHCHLAAQFGRTTVFELPKPGAT